MNGAMDKAKGTIKETAGKVMDDRKLEAEGKADKVKGHAKDAAEHAKKAVKEGSEALRKH